MNEELKTELGINEWLELIKEDKNLNGAYISICQYIYLTEKENQELKKQLEENRLNHKQLKDLEKTQLLNSYQAEKLIKLNNQQKEFINWLKAMSKMYEEEYKDIDVAEHYNCVLQKYKEIIGVSDEKEN